jgi:hypothetical protein
MRLALPALLIGLSVGCAALPDGPGQVADTERVAAIERAARHQGNQVIWLRYPTRSPDDLSRVTITVTTAVHGLSVDEVEARVTVPIESLVAAMPKTSSVRSRTTASDSYVEVSVRDATSDEAKRAVESALGSVQRRLPTEAARPMVGTTKTPLL